jgi:hypothetical protein
MIAEIKVKVVAKPAGTYLMDAKKDKSGTIFTTTRGAVSSTTFTLPPHSKSCRGSSYTFISTNNVAMIVQTRAADTLAVTNDLTADSLSTATASQMIGAVIQAVNDGSGWIAWIASVGITPTPAT